MPWPEPVTLRGTHAVLEPLLPAHHDDLVEAVKGRRIMEALVHRDSRAGEDARRNRQTVAALGKRACFPLRSRHPHGKSRGHDQLLER